MPLPGFETFPGRAISTGLHRVDNPPFAPDKRGPFGPEDGNGRFVYHMNSGTPNSTTVGPLLDLGNECHPFIGGSPVVVENNIGKTNLAGASNYFGVPISDPAKAPTFVCPHQVPIDTTNLPSGSFFTMQSVQRCRRPPVRNRAGGSPSPRERVPDPGATSAGPSRSASFEGMPEKESHESVPNGAAHPLCTVSGRPCRVRRRQRRRGAGLSSRRRAPPPGRASARTRSGAAPRGRGGARPSGSAAGARPSARTGAAPVIS